MFFILKKLIYIYFMTFNNISKFNILNIPEKTFIIFKKYYNFYIYYLLVFVLIVNKLILR